MKVYIAGRYNLLKELKEESQKLTTKKMD